MKYYTTKRCWWANRFYEAGEEVPVKPKQKVPDYFTKQKPAEEEPEPAVPGTLASLSSGKPVYDPGKPGESLRSDDAQARPSDSDPAES